ncbi:MAG: SPW repeat protein [Roseibium sp.]|uniref:SPW repeat protein n=1 Tax=Roseibium sp. TaxID=1936156 RepID=UPI002629F7BC|nr:SPW repeat protein [Roseibium sp.]MCV0429462.1 SPW repeat protein [Roseibium sp.]
MLTSAPNKSLEWINLTLGAALVAATLVTGFAADSAATWNAYVSGTVIVICATIALTKYGDWVEWTNVAAGGWLLIAPFVLGFASNAPVLWIHVLIGLAVAILAGTQLVNCRNNKTA